MTQTLLAFEQVTTAAATAAKLWIIAAIAAVIRQHDLDKHRRKMARQEAYRRKHPPGHAQCGIRWYPAGSGWTHCHGCGQALIYTTDHNAKPQTCKPRTP